MSRYLLISAIVLFGTVASGQTTISVPKRLGPKRSESHPNVILITIDTLRGDHVGCYSARNVKTPTLDGLAADGVVFERAISQVPLTWPSHAAILTGTYPFRNGVQDFTGEPLSPQFRSVAQAFKSAGYRTGAPGECRARHRLAKEEPAVSIFPVAPFVRPAFSLRPAGSRIELSIEIIFMMAKLPTPTTTASTMP